LTQDQKLNTSKMNEFHTTITTVLIT
jgi:hypothetical protein